MEYDMLPTMGYQMLVRNREFISGATRNSEEGKLDYEGFLSPLALARYAQYMHRHRELEDGTLRASDNWQKGIPPSNLVVPPPVPRWVSARRGILVEGGS